MTISTSTAAIFNPSAQNRVLVACVVVSLLLHALVLLLPGLKPSAPAPSLAKVLVATFASRSSQPESSAAPADAARRRESPPAPRLPEPPRRVETPRPVIAAPGAAAPRAAEVAPAAPAPETPSTPPAQGTAPSNAPGVAQRAAEPPSAAAGPATGTARAGSDADTGTLDQYRLALITAAKRYKRYPAQAMDRGWQGKVEVRLIIGSTGTIQNSLIKASSGYEILDNQALDMVKKAKPLTPIPAALRGKEFTVDVPVIFDLQAG